jgi:hypothetical protein
VSHVLLEPEFTLDEWHSRATVDDAKFAAHARYAAANSLTSRPRGVDFVALV